MPGKINNGASIGAVGPRKKKVSKRQPKRGLRSYAKAVAKYLASDTYMYAPLVEEAAVDGDRCSTSSSLSPVGTTRSPLNTGTAL
ncbi:hypothetical protein FCM35_KLT16683 [Carex littledalei]|uniref:Uncharacterized protein n=1 Tax=Carex littledalei TaxID=544730 RepID=A0A833RDB4_9POAL|nr:hypothetical protein FCM35_KLT16683 [Carex littledalei]